MKVALVYDRINKYGGAERVLEALHALWPDAPLYTGVYHPQKAAWAKDWDIHPSFLNSLPFLRDKHEYLAPLMPYAFESFDFSQYDIIISVTSAEAKGIITSPKQLHLCYLLTPTRYLWSHTHHYQGQGIKRMVLCPFVSSLRRWDFTAAQRPDYLIPISKYVARRTLKYYHRQPLPVIYPPVRYHLFHKHPNHCYTHPDKYYLVVSRLVSYKALGGLVQAWSQFPHDNLVIIGTGHQQKLLQKLAPTNVIFTGKVSDSKLVCLYHHAEAVIMPQEEDFGIVSLEAQAAGTPVISLKQSGAAETILPGKTGMLLDEITVSSLAKAFDAINHHTWYDKSIRQNAKRYNLSSFQKLFRSTVEELWQRHQLA